MSSTDSDKQYDIPEFLLELPRSARIYFVGISGISMSGLAELAHYYGHPVAGADMHVHPRINHFPQKGISVFNSHSKTNIDTFSPDLIVYTAAVLAGNPEIEYAELMGIPCVSRAEFLGYLTTQFEKVINIAGTHGKTTVTSMLATIMIKDHLDPTVHIGAQLPQFNGTVRMGKDASLFISEACEYQKSFLHFRSTTAAITNIDFDHVDCFKSIDEVIEIFAKFMQNIDGKGYLIIPAFDRNAASSTALMLKALCAKKLPVPQLLTTGLSHHTFSLTGKVADVYADNIVFYDGYPAFDVFVKGDFFTHIQLKIPGEHNIYNALTAIACAYVHGVSAKACQTALDSFSGAEGRFTIKGKYKGATVITDYAHHPAAARATLHAASKLKYNNIWVVFQPLTFNRTKILFDDYVTTLLSCPHIIFAEIFSDREVNPGDISSSLLADKINELGGEAEFFTDKKDIAQRLSTLVSTDDIILFLGPEDIRDMADLLIEEG